MTQQTIQVKIKKLHPDAVIPSYVHDTDAGLDMTATSFEIDGNNNCVYGTGLAFEIPEGYVGLLFPRSSNSKKDVLLTNSVGVLDSGYRGEVMFKFRPNFINSDNAKYRIYEVGERIGQLVIIPYPKINLVEADNLADSERGAGGYGSTGK